MTPLHLSTRIDALLPQTQCQRCGYKDCRAYAEAIADHGEALNRCPPGGAIVINALAELLGKPALPLDPDCGTAETIPVVAFVREAECIGCYKCAAVCPVDAIVGAPKRMHTVIESECTGCELCIPACPVDCIDMLPRRVDDKPALARAGLSRKRYTARNTRLQQRRAEREAMRASRLEKRRREARIASFLEAARQRIGPQPEQAE